MTIEVKQIMVIDDSEDYRELLIKKFSRIYQKARVDVIDPLNQPMPDDNFNWNNYDLLILDYQLGIEETGLDWFKKFETPTMPATILLTAMGSEEVAVNAIKIGVDQYLVKEKFENGKFIAAIEESILNKQEQRKKIDALSNQSQVFNKAGFFSKLEAIKKDRNTDDQLILVSPEAFHKVGSEKGIIQQDNYIRNVANLIFDYLDAENIPANIIIYREEYLALIIETQNLQKHLTELCKKLEKEKTTVKSKKYSCKVNAGVLSPKVMEESEINKPDTELLSIVLKLCELAKADKEKEIYYYGDIDIQDKNLPEEEQEVQQSIQNFDIEAAIADGRIIANYQPWVYVHSGDNEEDVKSIYDVRIELIDKNGISISQADLIKLLDNLFVKRVVDRWVIKNSITQLSSFHNRKEKSKSKSKKNHQIKLSAKLTTGSITDPDFYLWLKDLLIEAKLSKGSLLFEIDAAQFTKDPQHCIAIMKEINKKFAIKFILSGIYHIETYYQIRDMQKFEFVKLNMKSLSFGVPRNPVQELLGKIREDDAMVVAVNVTDAESLALATEFDIDYVHGYLIGKPNIDVIADSAGDLYCVM